MLKPNNILSYFIKDIKDPTECALYTQINTTNTIKIFYKDKLLYKLQHYKFQPEICWNYKNNIIKDYYLRRITNDKIDYSKTRNYKALFYKKDKIISKTNENYIMYDFIYNKYLIKKSCNYVADSKSLLSIGIQYYNGYKYKYKYLYQSYSKYKCKRVQILIPNKYEFHYINRFFLLFFVIRNY